MKKLSTQEANDIVAEALSTTTHQGYANEHRKVLKAAFRKLVNARFEDDDREKFHTATGVTINKLTDMVGMPVLLNVIVHGCGETLLEENGWNLGTPLNQLVECWKDDSKCAPSVKGGVSLGQHINMYSTEDCLRELKNMSPGQYQYTEDDAAIAACVIGRLKWGQEVSSPLTCKNSLLGDLQATSLLDNWNQEYTSGLITEEEYFARSIECWNNRHVDVATPNEVVPDYYNWAIGAVKGHLYSLGIDAAVDDLDHATKTHMCCAGITGITYEGAPQVIQELITAIITEAVQDTADAAMEAAANPVDDPETGQEIDDVDFTPVEPIPLDPNLKVAVDALLQQATGGKVTTSDYYTDHINKLNEEVLHARRELMATKTKLRDQDNAPKEVDVDGQTLTYEVVRRKAMDLFTDAKGRSSTKLDFEVNTLVWRDASGNEVRHPSCPVVDKSYKFRMHHLIKYLTAKEFGQHSWFHGHTGTGKTTFIEQCEARLGFPVDVLNLDSNLERSDIVGNIDIVVKDGAPMSVFTEGLLPRAMVQPMVFILDEIDAGRPDMLFVLQRALENKGLTLTEDAGRVVKPHKLFTFAATANSRGQGDEHGWYQGVRPMNLAFLNRFGAFIEVNYLDEDDEKQFLKDAYPKLDTRMADQFCAFSQLIRNSFVNGEISQTMSPRNLHAMANYYQHFTQFMSHSEAVDEVIETCVSDAAPADNQQRIAELSNRVFAGGL